ncbi:hypothetical protein NEMIN01_0222 [Nematocida minor]|uniref:uncharacterized protein n=1 Tax=Nematocida minor TaxID=1912983 RepID=UPI00221EEE04|nr:uncharacterized protein NEMIN01_0118 [Nematocida minor]XP_051332124.1 uncharacterized protein NEMIN01_0222 [Nematocida minor]KAI5188854.1 hypothetical protein NEMIN01_0118 [Nematocida minor]KAI5188958.1 hypothetical protein NEMIN01_0222 [Nematocida minor]
MYTLTNSLIAPAVVPKKSVFLETKEKLATGEKKKVMDAFHTISTKNLSHKEKAQVFPLILSLIGHSAIEVKCAAYSFILRTVRVDSSLLILSVNTVLQETKEDLAQKTYSNALKVSLAFDFISKISNADFLNHFSHEIEKGCSSRSDIVQKASLMAVPTLFRAFKETKLESVKQAVQSDSPTVFGASISAIISIEKQQKGTFTEKELLLCFKTLCKNRHKIEGIHGNFSLLFIDLYRLLCKFSNSEAIEVAMDVIEFLPLFAIRELFSISQRPLSPIMAEKIASSLISYIGTRHKTDALESILHLLQRHSVKLEIDPFLINNEDTKKEKIFKLYIVSLLNSKEGLSEIATFVHDRECVFHTTRLLLKHGILKDEHIRLGFQYSPASMLRAIYSEHPLPERFSPVIKASLAGMSNVLEKEAFLFLAGYYLSSVPDEANRIKRIRNSSGGVLYGRKEEREKPEEHLEEYLYFLLNMYTRGIINKEDCVQDAQKTFAEELFLLNKFTHLIDLPDRKHLLDLIAYKRVLYKISKEP